MKGSGKEGKSEEETRWKKASLTLKHFLLRKKAPGTTINRGRWKAERKAGVQKMKENLYLFDQQMGPKKILYGRPRIWCRSGETSLPFSQQLSCNKNR